MDQSKATSEKRSQGAALLKTAGERGAGRENDESDSRIERWEDAWAHRHTHTYTYMEQYGGDMGERERKQKRRTGRRGVRRRRESRQLRLALYYLDHWSRVGLWAVGCGL